MVYSGFIISFIQQYIKAFDIVGRMQPLGLRLESHSFVSSRIGASTVCKLLPLCAAIGFHAGNFLLVNQTQTFVQLKYAMDVGVHTLSAYCYQSHTLI